MGVLSLFSIVFIDLVRCEVGCSVLENRFELPVSGASMLCTSCITPGLLQGTKKDK